MHVGARTEPSVVRQAFPQWLITIPAGFEESFVQKDGYWHAWDAQRSVSLTSLLIADRRGRPVPAHRILKRFPAVPGERAALPPGLDGWAVVVAQPARAARAISGIVAVHGRALIATVTAEDLTWALGVWQSIACAPRRDDI